MFNVVRNAVFLLMLFFVAFGLSLFLSVLFKVGDELALKIIEQHGDPINTSLYGLYNNMKDTITTGIYVFLSLMIFITLISSMIHQTSVVGYILSGVGSLIITPIVIFIASEFWNRYIYFGIPMHNFVSVFASNFSVILILNLVFGLISFVFVKKAITYE
ncbi:MAG: hypothetical protein ABIK73_07325 [candidate division WOR-3 bacterium]